jgi:glycosyltransferase involved in cell wall biosynthesis
MTARAIVCWQPVLTDHQAYTFAALRDAAKVPVIVYALRRSDAVRAAQGWTESAVNGLDLRLVPEKRWLMAIRRIMALHEDAVHIFGSPFESARCMLALALALATRRDVYLLSEPYSPIAAGYLSDAGQLGRAVKARGRPLAYRLYGALLRNRIQGVFAISARAVQQFRAMGIAADRVFPFGYFVPRRVDDPPVSGAPAPPARLSVVFVGTLIERKGVADLARAVEVLAARGVDVVADVYGPGDAGGLSRVDGRLRYRGVIPFGRTQTCVAAYDVLVLPSHYDGWGVVVNEALQAGVPVICSDQVGAGGLVAKWGCGRIYPARDVGALADVLASVATSELELTLMRAACLKVRDSLEPVVAALYMQAVIDYARLGGARPLCPWYDHDK